MIMEAVNVFMERYGREILRLTGEHLELTAFSVLLGVLFGVPMGILLTRKKWLAPWVMGTTEVIMTIPSLAMLGFLLPLPLVGGIGVKPAITALFLYSLLAIVQNTYTGIGQVAPAMVEAGTGMGMTDMQVLRMVEFPLALPVIMAGVRIATVTNVGIATLAAAIGAGGLGKFIFRGISMVDNNMILMGAIPAAMLAIALDLILKYIENLMTPEGPSHKASVARQKA